MKKIASGFTLIEVLVALAIFAVAVASLSGAIQNNVKNATYLKNKTVAHWIASNKMVELLQTGKYPPLTDRVDKVEYAGREWVVNTQVKKQGAEYARGVFISAGIQGEEDDPNYFATVFTIVTSLK